MSVDRIEWLSGNLMQQNFRLTLDVQNPNDRALPVTRLSAQLSVAGQRVATGASTRGFVVPAQGHTLFDMTVAANMAAVLLQLAGRTDGAQSMDYDLTGSASVDLPLLHDLPFRQRGTLPLPLGQ